MWEPCRTIWNRSRHVAPTRLSAAAACTCQRPAAQNARRALGNTSCSSFSSYGAPSPSCTFPARGHIHPVRSTRLVCSKRLCIVGKPSSFRIPSLGARHQGSIITRTNSVHTTAAIFLRKTPAASPRWQQHYAVHVEYLQPDASTNVTGSPLNQTSHHDLGS